MEFVVFKGKKFEIEAYEVGRPNTKDYIRSTYLKLRNLNIKKFDEIEGLSEIY